MISVASGQSADEMPNLLVTSLCLKMMLPFGSVIVKVTSCPASGLRSGFFSPNERSRMVCPG